MFDKFSSLPDPDYHWHTDHNYSQLPKWQGEWTSVGVHLIRKSRLFWTFPDPCLGPPPENDPYYMLVTDARIKSPEGSLARGRQPEGLYPVKVAVPARYTEAMMLLNLRDRRAGTGPPHSDVELGYLLDPYHILGLNLEVDELEEPFREWAKRQSDDFYAEKVVKDPQGARYELELYLDMKRRNQLPRPDKRRLGRMEPFEELLQRFSVPYDKSDLVYG